MLGKSRIKEMMDPIEVANLFLFGFSRHARFLIGGTCSSTAAWCDLLMSLIIQKA